MPLIKANAKNYQIISYLKDLNIFEEEELPTAS